MDLDLHLDLISLKFSDPYLNPPDLMGGFLMGLKKHLKKDVKSTLIIHQKLILYKYAVRRFK